jgi:hypothetical protein
MKQRMSEAIQVVIGLVLLLPIVGAGVIRVVIAEQYDQRCGGYLKRAADANTPHRAQEELKKALQYIEQHNLTKGYTSIFYKTPDEDVGFWYGNLKEADGELDRAVANKNMSQLEASNVLMKLRETLLDPAQHGQTVTEPSGISIYPYNAQWAWLFAVTAILALIGVGLIYDNNG